MKKYKRRQGVVLLNICGESLLVATKEARGLCPYVTQLNESAAEYWNLFDDIYSVNDVVEREVQRSGKEKSKILLPVLMFIERMRKSGYLVEVESE